MIDQRSSPSSVVDVRRILSGMVADEYVEAMGKESIDIRICREADLGDAVWLILRQVCLYQEGDVVVVDRWWS